MLVNWLSTDLYEREGKAITNFSSTLPEIQGDLAQQITKDPYLFDFLYMREDYDERDLEDALVSNVTKFLLELGKGFSYMGRQRVSRNQKVKRKDCCRSTQKELSSCIKALQRMIGKSPGEEVRLSPPLGDVRPTGSKSLGEPRPKVPLPEPVIPRRPECQQEMPAHPILASLCTSSICKQRPWIPQL